VVQARAPPKKGKADDYGESVYLEHTNTATVLLTHADANYRHVAVHLGMLSSGSAMELTSLGGDSTTLLQLPTVDGAIPMMSGAPSASQSAEDILDLETLVERTELVFKLLQLACEDFCDDFKNYLREQKDSLHQVNLVRRRFEALHRALYCDLLPHVGILRVHCLGGVRRSPRQRSTCTAPTSRWTSQPRTCWSATWTC